MALTEDLIGIQGIFIEFDKNEPALKNIKFKGGNETVIIQLTEELHKFLSSKHYIKNDEINSVFDQQLQHIVLFMLLNTEVTIPFDAKEHETLIGIMPKMSPCVLANLITNLGLCKYYCTALMRFHFFTVHQLLNEMISCIARCEPKLHFSYGNSILELIVAKIFTASNKDAEAADLLTDIAAEILLKFNLIEPQQIKNMTSVYELMGYNLLNLLHLLLTCDENNDHLLRMIDKLLKTCSSIVMAVTLDVFCFWAEVDHEAQNLQSSVAEKAYYVVEKYKKYPPAKDLIMKLGTIARKPKTLTEQILLADVSLTISMVNKADENQRKWFNSLLNSEVLDNQDCVKCLERWAHLCDLGDVCKLLKMCCRTKNTEAIKVVLTCAATLDVQELRIAIARHFYANGTETNLKKDVHEELVILFNKIKEKGVEEELSKSLQLLLLQNPEQTFRFMFSECVKSTFYSHSLKNVFLCLKDIAKFNDVGLMVLKEVIDDNKPNENNFRQYETFLGICFEVDFFTVEKITLQIMLPLMQEATIQQNFDLVKSILEIINTLQNDLPLMEETEEYYKFICNLLKNCRCGFFNFVPVKQETAKQVVDILNRVCSERSTETKTSICLIEEDNDLFMKYYKQKLDNYPEVNIIKHFLPSDLQDHYQSVAELVKILPCCVAQEWQSLTSGIVTVCGPSKTIELLADFLILICKLVESQATKTEEVQVMLVALKYCLQNVGIVVKHCIQPVVKDLEEDVALTRNICRIIRYIPDGSLKSEEGLSLANLLSEASLQSLRNDKMFAAAVVSIKETRICHMLAKKALNR